MNGWNELIGRIIAAFIVIAIPTFLFIKIKTFIEDFIITRRCKKQWKLEEIKEVKNTEIIDNIEIKPEPQTNQYSDKYEKKYLLTINERDQFRKLKAWAAAHDSIVFAKVRVLDLIEPQKGIKNYQTYFWKIQAKHVDFVICDQDIKVKCIIELDDNSHKSKDREERDKFLDEALTGAGYKVLRTKYISPEFLNQI